MATPHDALFKFVFSDPENAASELRAVLPAELSSRIDWTSLAVVPGSFVDERLTSRHSDILFSVLCDGRRSLLYVLLEHQSTPDRFMAFRVLGYVVRIWDAFLREHEDVTAVPAVIPVVVHHGRERWSVPTELSALIDLGPELLSLLSPYLPQLRFVLDDLGPDDERVLHERSLTDLARLGLLLLSRGRDNPDLLADLGRWLDALGRVVAAPHGVAALAALLEYAFQVADVLPEDLRHLARKLGPAAEEAYVTAAQKLTEQVRTEALARGKAEGKAELVLRLLSLRFGPLPSDVAERVRKGSPTELELWAERVLSAAALDEIFR